VFIVREVVYQLALDEFCHVLFGSFVGDLLTLGGGQAVLP
jgi:hypothetical protein